jgi:peptidoglycan/xylan/chitin deacetylase (PgdA/CDA1 family)
MKKVTIVMYHYVRKIKNSLYPKIKGLEFSKFKKQLNYLNKNYTIITPDEFIEKKKIQSKKKLCLLTFDDGFKDHIKYVLPELKKRKLKACFFPPALPIMKNKLLDVLASPYILAKTKNYSTLFLELNKMLSKKLSKKTLRSLSRLYYKKNSYDNKEVNFIKRILQRGLPDKFRKEIIKTIFNKIFKRQMNKFSTKTYMSIKDLKKLIKNGMYVGSHSYSHLWLNELKLSEQKLEINNSLRFLKKIGAPTKNWIMCYPYGAYNKLTLSILKNKKCLYGFTTQKGVANLEKKPLELNRIDTNELPC